ncbi:hypothetical protein FRC17_004986 [Serendipita sp. 399]|nr:hypothetical protein FRC17_004986 [Serendipita sp. 399]
MPAEILGVKMTSLDTGGSLSRFGWPAKCSDLQFDLENGIEGGIVGTPPYTLTVAPALRTPVNITFEKSARWTIMLDHGHPFFVSIVDSKGVTWSNGPLHAGAGTLSCFAPARPYPWLTLGASLGMSFSFLVVGAVLASLVFLWYMRRPQFDVGPAAGHIGEAPENSRQSSHHQRHLSSTFSRESKSRMSTNTTNRQQHQQQEESHLSSRSRHGSTSPTAVGTVLTSLHRRRPSNTRATSSSEMGLMMRHRPSLRREETSGTIDLAGSPIDDEGQHTFPPPPQPNYNNNNSTLSRRENDPNYIIPWSQLAHENRGQEPFVPHEEGRGSIPNTPGIPILKHRDTSTSNSSGVPSPTAGGGGAGVTVTPGQEMPSNFPSGNIRPNVVSLPSLPRTGDFAVSNATQASVPLISLPRPQHYSHQASFSSVSSSSIPPHHQHQLHHPQQMMSTPSQQQQQQQQHTHTHEVYVVHHDAGLPPPVTVFTRPGTLVTELPPGYDHIISTSQQPDHPVHFDESQIYDGHGASTPMRPLKGRPSTSNADSQQQQQQQQSYMQQGASRPGGGTGLALVHPEDVPLSAISPTSPSTFPQPSSQQSTDERFHQS